MNRMTAIFIVCALTGAGAPAVAQAAAPMAKTYRSCDQLHKRYPAGVAKNAKAANRAVQEGYSRPATSSAAKKVYWQNQSNLDRDRDGVACES